MTGTGIFNAFKSLDLPWGDDATTANNLDILFITTYGDRLQSPILSKFYDKDGEGVSSADIAKLASMLKTLYDKSWSQLWESYIAEYNPINNYDRTEETETSGSDELSFTNRTDTDTETPNGWKIETKGTSANNTTETENKRYGFNSATAVPTDESNTEVNTDMSQERKGTMTRTHGKAGKETTEHTHNVDSHIYGNIGVTTTAQMITGEIDLWSAWTYFESVFKDILKTIALAIY